MIDTTISHYRVVERVAHGGMGIVYKAVDTRLHRFVALKFLPLSLGHEALALIRYQIDAQAVSALKHPNICAIYEVAVKDNQAFLAMEFLEGLTLKNFLIEKPIEVKAIYAMAIEVASALEAAHAVNVLHRDVRPGNIFVTTQGVAKLLDFGLAKVLRKALPLKKAEEPAKRGGEGQHLGGSGTSLSAAAYMSPEQASGGDIDARSDLFSLGAVLYEMCTHTAPFCGDTPQDLLRAIVESTPVAAAQLNPDLPVGLAGLLTKALAKDRNQRYQSAAEMRSDLQRLKRNFEYGGDPAAAEVTTSMSVPVFRPSPEKSDE